MVDDTQRWNELAEQIAIDSIRATTTAGSGHPTSSMSAAHLLAVLFADHLRFDVKAPDYRGNDRFILSKGHAAPGLYAVLKAIGAFDDDVLLSLRKEGSPLQGHPAPIPELPWVDVATGSLGQGLAAGLGMALAMRLDDIDARVWVMLGDSEMAEGSVWEAMEATSFHGAANVTAILDLNRLGQRGPTMHQWDVEVFRDRALAFGWNAIVIDGHDVTDIDRAYTEAEADDRPTFIVARTEKGHGVSFLANAEGWHGKAVPADREDEAIAELGGVHDIRVTPPAPVELPAAMPANDAGDAKRPAYDGPIATRKAFGEALAWLAATNRDVVALDGEVGNSTYTEDVEEATPDRFVELYIAEQTMIGVATGLQALGKVAFAATFGAFLTRAADQIRMGAISRANLRISGSHAGVSIGEDGPSQMAVEDLSLFRAINGSTVLYPADGASTVALIERMASLEDISYLRTTREATPVLYGADEDFPIGGSKTHGADASDLTLIGAGVTLHECMVARERLLGDGIGARVIDVYSVKPIDADSIRRALDETGVLIVVEDHRVEGGIGDAVLDAIAATGELTGRVVKIGVDAMPGSATPEQLRAWAGIDADSIAAAARRALGR